MYNASSLYYTKEPTNEYEFASYYLNLSNFDQRAIAHRPEQFIKVCKLAGNLTEQCAKLMKSGGNQRTIGLENGICYTYNMIGKKIAFGNEIDTTELEKVDSSGEYYGLELILDLGGMFLAYVTATWNSINSILVTPLMHAMFAQVLPHNPHPLIVGVYDLLLAVTE